MASALLINGVPVECINQAAISYHVPAVLIVSVLLTEGGRIGSMTPNTNGTFDYGPMQINTVWLSKIKPYGISEHDIQYDPCVNVGVGAWILGQRIADSPDVWYGIGSYNSYSLSQNSHYKHKVSNVYERLHRYLSSPESSTNRPSAK